MKRKTQDDGSIAVIIIYLAAHVAVIAMWGAIAAIARALLA